MSGTREHIRYVVVMACGPDVEAYVYLLPPRGTVGVGALVPPGSDVQAMQLELEEACARQLPVGIRYRVRVAARLREETERRVTVSLATFKARLPEFAHLALTKEIEIVVNADTRMYYKRKLPPIGDPLDR